ncbi:MAG TPA: hypothetical protein VKV74_15740 [Bryobacteraceae bacterium]|nr:hypothetical protein [Bryobacteraceae bacterium]
MNRPFVLLFVVCAACSSAQADFTYRETTRIRGSKRPVSLTKIVKGDRMAEVAKDHIAVVDLDKETITQIDLLKKTYFVLTFAQMKQTLNAVAPQVKIERPAVQTGRRKNIGVLAVKENILTLTLEGRATVTVDFWVATAPGYDEVRSFQRKLIEKLGYGFGSGLVVNEFRDAVAEQLSKIDGAPVQSITKVISMPGGEPIAEAATDLSDFLSGPADASKFEAPQGFKQIQPDPRQIVGAR